MPPPRLLMMLLLMLPSLPLLGVVADTTKEECRQKVASCTADSSKNVPVCGSDGFTYPSHCALMAKQCLGMPVLHKREGLCRADMPSCLRAVATAPSGSKPLCRDDGSYALQQCHDDTGFCWCVSRDGRPLPGSALKGPRPRCGSQRKMQLPVEETAETRSALVQQRRQQQLPMRPARRRQQQQKRRQYKQRQSCDKSEKARFNANLIDNFKIEYRRTNMSNAEDLDTSSNKSLESVLSWKFAGLDRNSDGYLERSEYKELRRLAKKVVRPKKCARTFARSCDFDRDLKLSRQEWNACLGSEFTVLKGDSSPVRSRPTFKDDPPEPSDDTEANDCISDRRSVMEDQRQNSQEKFYIPECTPDGRYHKVQCYSGYCWCVYQDTGKPIPGTSSKDQTPNCNPVPAPVRPMKGCPEAKKQLFLRDLMDLMAKKMRSSSSGSDELATDKWQASREERVATWHFVMLDKNKNKVLERKEWKSFRAMVANNRQLRRCGKKLPRYCDINNDRRISMTEWLSCLNAQRPPPTGDSSTEKASTLKPRRTGPNPLDIFLNDDD